MKLNVEIPMVIVNKGYDKTDTINKYDTNGTYLGVVTTQRSFIPIYAQSSEKEGSTFQDQLKKMTKIQLLKFIQDHYTYTRYEMEVLV